jgi:hypothetical protein
MPSDPVYMREYVLARHHRRRGEVIRRLGGYCWECYSTDNLQIDHIDPATKDVNFDMAGLASARVEAEIVKCQLLCTDCHAFKTVVERGKTWSRGTHGTISSYRWCGPPKCDACKNAKRLVHRSWVAKNRGLTKPS